MHAPCPTASRRGSENLNHVEPALRRRHPGDQSTPIIPRHCEGSCRGWRGPRGPPCSALVRWHVWHVRTYSAMSTSCPTQKAKRRTSDPVLAQQSVLRAARHGTPGRVPARAARRPRGCTAGPPRPGPDGTAGSIAPRTPRAAGPARRLGWLCHACRQACRASLQPPARWARRRRRRPAPAPRIG